MDTRRNVIAIGAAVLAAGVGGSAFAQEAGVRIAPARYAEAPRVLLPDSSLERAADKGIAAHTNIRVLNVKVAPDSGVPVKGYLYETPASLACVYGLVTATAGCNPNTVSKVSTAGSGVIAIVDAYHYPTALADLKKYSSQFGLPAPDLQVVYASGAQPPQDSTGGWELEEALDISMAHALAPKAKIILVEANSNSFADLFAAEKKAGELVAAAGGGQVSNSWGGAEFNGETAYDSYFAGKNVVYVASSGDAPGTEYPSASPNVVSAGGTSIGRNPATGAFEYEITWDQGGGGPSKYEARPSFQNSISAIVGSTRGLPDVALDANPETGVFVYDSTPVGSDAGWWVVGGTSVAAPSVAGLINAAGSSAASSAAELKTIYANMANGSDYADIVSGACGPNEGYPATKGWDFCSGAGAPVGFKGK